MSSQLSGVVVVPWYCLRFWPYRPWSHFVEKAARMMMMMLPLLLVLLDVLSHSIKVYAQRDLFEKLCPANIWLTQLKEALQDAFLIICIGSLTDKETPEKSYDIIFLVSTQILYCTNQEQLQAIVLYCPKIWLWTLIFYPACWSIL